jgi:hypothetical protein
MENPIPISESYATPPVLKPSYISSFENATKQFKKFWKVLFSIAVVNLIIGFLFQIPSYLRISENTIGFQAPKNSLTPFFGHSGWGVLYLILVCVIR